MKLVINIKDDLFDIIPFLYPNLSIEHELRKSDRFILKMDIRSKKDMMNLEDRFDDYVVISKVLYNENWDEAKIIEQLIEFSRVRFKCRKRTLPELLTLEGHEFIDRAKQFMFEGSLNQEEEESILELFNLFGQAKFIERFLQMAETIPVQKLVSSINTFVTKVAAGRDSSSLFYKKKAIVLDTKIISNYKKAIENFNYSHRDPHGLNYLKFYIDLVQ